MSHLKFLCVFFEPDIQSYEMVGGGDSQREASSKGGDVSHFE